MNETNRPHLRILPESIIKRPTDFDGGGFTYRRNDYRTHGRTLIGNVQSIALRAQSTSDCVKDRAFIEVRLAPGEKLKDRFKNLMNNARITVIDLVNESVGYGVIKTDDIVLLENRLREYAESDNHTGKSYFSFVDELRTVDGKEKLSPEIREIIEKTPHQKVTFTVESFSSLPRGAMENGVIQQLRNFLKDSEGDLVSSYIHSSGSVVAEIQATAAVAEAIVTNFDSIRSIEITPRIMLPRIESMNNPLENFSVRQVEGDAVVCIFDTGVATDNEFLNPFVLERLNAINGDEFDHYHGTFVASRVIYRDTVLDQMAIGELTPFVKVLDVRVFNKHTGLNESQLIEVVRKTVSDYHNEIKVYNLSLGFLVPDTDFTALNDVMISRIAAELDFLSKKYDVLFVISAGNINSVYEKLTCVDYPHHFSDDTTRILPPGEAFLGLTVGSIVKRYENGAISEKGHPSAFSRRGPGFAGTRKPDLCADGGNITKSGNQDARIAASALGQSTGELSYDVGTSFSAPVVASYAAEIFDRLPDASPNLVKALMMHFSKHPDEVSTFGRADKFEHIGFGVPDLELCFESLKSKATYVFEGSIPQQTYVKIPFWLPTVLATDTSRSGRKKAKVRITLVWNPLTDRRKGEEYSLVHIYPNLFKLDANGDEHQLQLTGLDEISYREKFYPVTRIEKQFERNFGGGAWGASA